MIVYSFDSAFKSLGLSIMNLISFKKTNLTEIKENLKLLRQGGVDILHLEVFNVSSSSLAGVCRKTKKVLDELTLTYPPEFVLIEKQFKHYKTINPVLISYFSFFGLKDKQIVVMNPRFKNLLSIEGEEDTRIQYHIEKYKRLYTANKNHSKKLFKIWLEKTGDKKSLKLFNAIPAKNKDDVADSALMLLYWYKFIYSKF